MATIRKIQDILDLELLAYFFGKFSSDSALIFKICGEEVVW